MKKFLLILSTLILGGTVTSAAIKDISAVNDTTIPQKQFHKRIYITTLTITPPEIDGKLNDECWQGGNWDEFIFQREPVDAGIPTERTIVKVVYDDENIYSAIKCYDSSPDKIAEFISSRDSFNGDMAGVCFDSYFDKRTSFEFALTAAGVKSDYIVSNGNEINFNWNPVWDGKVSVDDSSWNAEFKIPLSQLRFTDKDIQTWGFMAWRWIYRKSEENDWGPNPITTSTWVDQYGTITGIKGIKAPSRIELLPYTLGKYHSFEKEIGNPFRTGSEKQIDFGMDAKIGISGGFNLDLTINPDFGQVEADPSQISLSSYELEYDEKRPFFIEGNDILSFPHLYYPRRIGHLPSFEPELGNNEYADIPLRTTILGAAKLTGKTDDGLSVGVMESVTAKETAEIQSGNKKSSTVVEPLTNYFVGRVQKELDEGNIIYGGAFTAVNRNINEDHLQFLPNAAYSGGLDFTYKWDDKNYSLYAAAIFSHILGNKKSITRVQHSPVHYFQRPDADYLGVDSNKTSLSGFGGGFEFKKGGGGNWRFAGSVKWLSPNLEVNDIGYLPQVDRIYQETSIGYVVQTPAGILRNYSVYFEQNSTWNYGGDNYEFETGIFTNITFINRWRLHLDLFRDFEALSPSLIWAGPLFKRDGAWSYEIEVESDGTKPFTFELGFEKAFHDDGISQNYSLTPSARYRVTNALTISGQLYYDFTRNNLQYITTRNLNGEDFYFLGTVDQNVWGITTRITFNITPDLSIQYYGSPFSATRKYSAIKKVTDPKADDYNNRFHLYTANQVSFDDKNKKYLIDNNNDGVIDFSLSNPDMSFNEFRSNLVVRWEYNPGSTIYLVWSQNRSGVMDYESSSFGKTVNRVFNIYPDNIFMIKLNHWFSL